MFSIVQKYTSNFYFKVLPYRHGYKSTSRNYCKHFLPGGIRVKILEMVNLATGLNQLSQGKSAVTRISCYNMKPATATRISRKQSQLSFLEVANTEPYWKMTYFTEQVLKFCFCILKYLKVVSAWVSFNSRQSQLVSAATSFSCSSLEPQLASVATRFSRNSSQSQLISAAT